MARDARFSAPSSTRRATTPLAVRARPNASRQPKRGATEGRWPRRLEQWRSEERRVGEEGGFRWWRGHYKKKKHKGKKYCCLRGGDSISHLQRWTASCP